jgi:hypothetical protein
LQESECAFGVVGKILMSRFWKEKSVEDVGTLGPTAQATIVYIISNVKYRLFLAKS